MHGIGFLVRLFGRRGGQGVSRLNWLVLLGLLLDGLGYATVIELYLRWVG